LLCERDGVVDLCFGVSFDLIDLGLRDVRTFDERGDGIALGF